MKQLRSIVSLFLLLYSIAVTLHGQQVEKFRPNILWITCEDMSIHLGSYGNKLVKTPNLDKLAADGVRYTRTFATAGICAPSRSAIIAGMYQQSGGTQHMRTHKYPGNPAAAVGGQDSLYVISNVSDTEKVMLFQS